MFLSSENNKHVFFLPLLQESNRFQSATCLNSFFELRTPENRAVSLRSSIPALSLLHLLIPLAKSLLISQLATQFLQLQAFNRAPGPIPPKTELRAQMSTLIRSCFSAQFLPYKLANSPSDPSQMIACKIQRWQQRGLQAQSSFSSILKFRAPMVVEMEM